MVADQSRFRRYPPAPALSITRYVPYGKAFAEVAAVPRSSSVSVATTPPWGMALPPTMTSPALAFKTCNFTPAKEVSPVL